MKLITKKTDFLSPEEIRQENLLKYGEAEPWSCPRMQEYENKLHYFREAVVAKALGLDFNKVRLNGNADFYKRYFDRIPILPEKELKQLTEKRSDPKRYITSHIWGYEQSNVEIAEWIESFNGLQVFINDNQIFFSRPTTHPCYDFPQVKECSCISYDLNPRTYEECYKYFSEHDDPHNGYTR